MKYKTLVMGKSNSIIDDFFIHMSDDLEVISCSTRYGDIIRHLKYFMPDVFIYCLYNEAQESIRQMITIKPMLTQSRTPFIIAGSKEDCDEFERTAVNVADIIYVKPFTAASLNERIVKYLNERQPYLEEYRAKNAALTGAVSADAAAKEAEAELDALNIPSREELEKLAARLARPSETPAPKPLPAVSNERRHILIVDDDPIMLKTVKEQLHDEFDVATAISGKIALKFLERKKTDLILLDYEMPEENGPAVLGKIRENDDIKDIPVVFLTGVSDKDKIKEAIVLKPQGYLLKPIDHEKLMETIKNLVR